MGKPTTSGPNRQLLYTTLQHLSKSDMLEGLVLRLRLLGATRLTGTKLRLHSPHIDPPIDVIICGRHDI